MLLSRGILIPRIYDVSKAVQIFQKHMVKIASIQGQVNVTLSVSLRCHFYEL